jgi:hypothetical protein
MIKVTLDNWLHTFEFEVTQEEIDEYNESEFIEDEPNYELTKGNNYTIDTSACFEGDPYYIFFPDDKFILVTEYLVIENSDEEASCGYGLYFQFINCECPKELEKYLNDDYLYLDFNNKLITDNNVIQKIIEEETNEVFYFENDSGTGCVRLSDLDKIFKYVQLEMN